MYLIEAAYCLVCDKTYTEYDIEHQETDACPHCNNDEPGLIMDIQTEEG